MFVIKASLDDDSISLGDIFAGAAPLCTDDAGRVDCGFGIPGPWQPLSSNPLEFTMPRRFVDISVPLEMGIVSDPPMMLPTIDYVDHKQSAEGMANFFPGLSVDQLPGGEGWAVEFLQIATHNGTHLDAPYHISIQP